MKDLATKIRKDVSLYALSAIWLFALLNPVFKKYDYGAGWPVVVLMCVLLLGLLLFEAKKSREKNLLENGALLVFTVAVGISMMMSQTQNLGLSEVVAFFSGVALYLLYGTQRVGWIERFLKVVGVGAILAAFLGFLMYFCTSEPRMYGPFFNVLYHANVWPNAFALFLLIVWPVFIFLFRKKWNFVSVATISLVLSTLLLTFSRGAMIAFCGQIVLLGGYFFRRASMKRVLGIFAVVVFSGILFVGANYLRSSNFDVIDVEDRVEFAGDEGLTSKQERIDFWLGSIDLIQEKPVFGWGPFSFRYAYNGIQKTFLGASDHPHNLFLKIGVENGLIALAAFLFFGVSLFTKFVRRFSGLGKENRDLAYILFVSIAGLVAHNLIDYNLNFYANIFLMFMFLAFIRSLLIKKVSKKTSPVFGVFLIVVVAGISFYEGALLVLSYADTDYLQYSYYPRFYNLAVADMAFQDEDYFSTIVAAENYLELNPLDAQAYYLRGLANCGIRELSLCKSDLEKAIELDPMNNFYYYQAYLENFEDEETTAQVLELLAQYFTYVQNNVHFTAYTTNVEAAAAIIDIVAPTLDETRALELLAKKAEMLAAAAALRNSKEF